MCPDHDTDASILPYSLGNTLLGLPTIPQAPRPLIVATIWTVLAILILFLSFFAGSCQDYRKYASMKLWCRHPPLPDNRRDSMMTLVYPAPPKRRKSVPHFAFACASLLTFALVLAGSAIELRTVSKVRAEWDTLAAYEVGLTMTLGGLIYGKLVNTHPIS